MMLSPGSVLKSAISGIPWFFSLAVSAVAFGLFFLQTGLDLYKTGQKGIEFAILSAGAGAVYGITVIPLLGAIIWCILKMVKSDKSIGWAVSSFCLSYSGTGKGESVGRYFFAATDEANHLISITQAGGGAQFTHLALSGAEAAAELKKIL